MIFGYDDNNFALSGQRLYDHNREALRREILQTLVNSSIPDQNQFLHHGVAIEALKTGFLKAVKDENLSMIETIYSTLQHNKFNFTAAENFDEFSTLFLSNELQSETLEFLCRQTSMTQDRDHNGYSFLSKINMINSALKSENLDLLIENIVINNPKSYQEIPQTSPISIYQKSNLSNEEAKNLSVIK
jgi:hypothetical protein